MVLAHHALDDPNLQSCTNLPHPVPNPFNPHLPSGPCNDISSPKQSDIQSCKPCGSHTDSPSCPLWPVLTRTATLHSVRAADEIYPLEGGGFNLTYGNKDSYVEYI
jgi:hypothetical protein